MTVLIDSRVRELSTLASLRRAVARAAEACGVEHATKTRLVTATSELARLAHERDASFRLVVQDGALELAVDVADRALAKQLSALLEVTPGKDTIRARLPIEVDEETLELVRLAVLAADPDEATAELWRQNRKLLEVVEERVRLADAVAAQEEQWRMAGEIFGMGAWTLTSPERVELSDHAAALLGTEVRECSVSGFAARFVSKEVESAVEALWRKKARLEIESALRESDRILALRAQRIRGDRVIGALLDVTEVRQREAEAKRFARFQQELIGIVSHDLKSPLGAFSTGLSLLEEAELEPEDRVVVYRMRSAAHSMQRLVHDLLDFTHARLGRGLPISLSEVELRTLLEGAVERVALHHRDAHLEMVVEDVSLVADGARIEQAVTNLLENAMQHGPGGARVESHVQGGIVEIQVWNGGDPIPPERITEVFTPLRSTGGKVHLGLGLYIVERVAHAHGGGVDVTSSEEEGTTFTLRIPVRGPR